MSFDFAAPLSFDFFAPFGLLGGKNLENLRSSRICLSTSDSGIRFCFDSFLNFGLLRLDTWRFGPTLRRCGTHEAIVLLLLLSSVEKTSVFLVCSSPVSLSIDPLRSEELVEDLFQHSGGTRSWSLRGRFGPFIFLECSALTFAGVPCLITSGLTDIS